MVVLAEEWLVAKPSCEYSAVMPSSGDSVVMLALKRLKGKSSCKDSAVLPSDARLEMR